MRQQNKTITAIILIIFALVFSACADSSSRIEQKQQEGGQLSLLQNQPVPDLGGFSLERKIVIETYQARNRVIATYTYTMTYDGRIIEICASIGYPIPYATQLTNPLRYEYNSNGAVLGNPEPNGLYTPSSAEATLVQCVNEDGSVTPTYWEDRIFTLPYRIQSDIQLARIGDAPSFTIDTGR